ncbi:carbohydrate kinase family protein [Candidatus Bathyarchaeota archaeon]|nr:carbohydrate kinase family protein [Candidatus Bathyarchaeota archaeon]
MLGYLEELQRFLESETEAINVVVMPDFFLDRLISLNCDVKNFCRMLGKVAKRNGGSIDGIEQVDLKGGNAINTASALAALDVKVTPIVCTSKLGSKLIKSYLKPRKVDLSHVKIFDNASITTAIELENGKGKVNVMLRDVGALAAFGPQDLNDEDFEAIENADYVCVFNWAGTRRFGTELAETIFHRVKTAGKGKTYCDTADPTANKEKIPKLMKKVLQSKHVDILSLNENEAICYASQLNDTIEKLTKTSKLDDLAKESARILASRLSARVDLHTASFSATFTKKGETIVPAFKVPVLRVTGAGDAWNAGNILGDAHRLSDEHRLALANAVAAYYISNPKGTHPTRKKLVQFIDRWSKELT